MKGCVCRMKILLVPDNPLNEIDSLVDIQEKQAEKLKDSRVISIISLVLMLYTCIVGNYPLSSDIEMRDCFELMEAFLVIAIISMAFSIYYQHCLGKTMNKISALKDHYIFYSAYSVKKYQLNILLILENKKRWQCCHVGRSVVDEGKHEK